MQNSIRYTVTLCSALLLAGVTLSAQGTAVKTGPMPWTSPASGAEMYGAYCATCHGRTGVGDGPAARALKTPPADLTILAKKNNGKFPSESVMEALRSGPAMANAHGSKDMPIWGPLFSASGEAATVTQRLHNLAAHVESLQVK
jgi:mono/diheme cytochrome c family protein